MICPKCKGFGKVSSHNGETWKQFTLRPHNASPELSDGTAAPVICPKCNGEGNVPEPQPEPVVDTLQEAEAPDKKSSKKSP